MIRLEPRAEASKVMTYASPLVAVLLMFVCGFIFATLSGQSPVATFKAFFISPVADWYGVGELLLKAVPLILIGVGLAIGFRSNIWNIGAEGQLTLGAIAGGGIGLLFYNNDGFWVLPLMIVCGAIGGGLWAMIPAYLRTRFNTSEILTSLMLNYVALLLLSYLVHGPWRSPEGFNFPESRMFQDNAMLPVIMDVGRLHAGVFIAIAVVLGGWFFMKKSFLGYQMQAAGMAERAAGYAGFSRNRMVWLAFLIGGGAAGLAGVGEVAGPIGQLLPSVSPGYGYAAIIVAFIGRLHPIGITLAGLLMSLLYLGGESAQVELGMPAAVTGIFQGILLFFLLASDVFIRFRLVLGSRSSDKKSPSTPTTAPAAAQE